MIRGEAPDALAFAWQREPPCAFPDPRRRSQDGGEPNAPAELHLEHERESRVNRLETREGQGRTDDRPSSAAVDENARLALVTAGYKSSEARAAVKNARPHVGASATLEQVLREALRQCATSVFGRDARLPSDA